MRIVVINLERASDRRANLAREFAAVGLPYELKTAVDGRGLSPDQLAQVDRDGRRRLGLRPQDNGSIACWLSHREVMEDIVANGPEMAAVFEDDARLTPSLPAVLDALEDKPFSFDVVSLYRGHPRRAFIPCVSLTEDCAAGRVRYSDTGTVGYVITRDAAGHFLRNTPRMVLAIDHALFRFWASGLNTFYVDPPVVHHGGADDSEIHGGRRAASATHRDSDSFPVILWRRAVAGGRRSVRKRLAFRRLLRGDIGVTRWAQPSEGNLGKGPPEPQATITG